MPDLTLSANEIRVLGCLMEKSVITPEQYPLSLNALVAACNQKSSREPVLSLEPGAVQRAVNELAQKRLVMVQNYGSRVDKYLQRWCNTQFAQVQLTGAEFAIVCSLLLRGPQTPGELKAHSGRLHEFGDLAEVEEALRALLERTDAARVARLPREPRRKDHCYAHVLAGPIESVEAEEPPPVSASRPAAARGDERVAGLEARVEALERELQALKQALGVE